MRRKQRNLDYVLFLSVVFLLLISMAVLRVMVPAIFPIYFVYVVIGIVSYFVFLRTDFNLLNLLSRYLYVISIFLLILPLILGEITRGTVRWIPLGPVAVQPSELVRPFLILFFANYLTVEYLSFSRLIKSGILLALPLFLIIVQPSLGVAVLTSVAFGGVLLASTIDKKYILVAIFMLITAIPFSWSVMAPYQKQRITTFINPNLDPLGAGYNSIQSMISVGSGEFFGRGLGEGVQTQLAFLPERHNDFIFASIAEELGFIGVSLVLLCQFVILWRLTKMLEFARNATARAYVSGVFLVLFFQITFNVGMNMGLFPITGIPLPLVSAGGSSLISTLVALGIANSSSR